MSSKFGGAPFWPVWLLGGAALGALLQAGAVAFPWPEPLRDRVLWLGNNGIVGTAVGALTLVSVIAAAVQLRHNMIVADRAAERERRIERSDRFTRATDLLSSPESISRLAGMEMIRRLAKEEPDEFASITINAMCALIREETREEYTKLHDLLYKGQSVPILLSGGENQIEAMETISALSDYRSTTFSIVRTVLAGVKLRDLKFEYGRFFNTIVNNVTFLQCDLKAIRFHTLYARLVEFRDCDLVSSRLRFGTFVRDDLTFHQCDLRYARVVARHRKVVLTQCDVTLSEIDADEVEFRDCWIEVQHFLPIVHGQKVSPQSTLFVAGGQTPFDLTTRGFRMYGRPEPHGDTIVIVPQEPPSAELGLD